MPSGVDVCQGNQNGALLGEAKGMSLIPKVRQIDAGWPSELRCEERASRDFRADAFKRDAPAPNSGSVKKIGNRLLVER